jgi:hypothetical protein
MSLWANPVKYLNQITEDLRMDEESRSATWNGNQQLGTGCLAAATVST